jgi:hypothetical protein
MPLVSVAGIQIIPNAPNDENNGSRHLTAVTLTNHGIVATLDSNRVYQAAVMLDGLTVPRNDITVHVSWTAGTLHSFVASLPSSPTILLRAGTFYPVGFGTHCAVITLKLLSEYVLDTFEINFNVEY